jgi:hypothetical protein
VKYSTNALTARYCALHGWPCETIQSWRGRQRHDAFGIADSLILTGTSARLVQNCSYGTLKAHRDAIDQNPLMEAILRSYLILELWEWRRRKLKRGGTNKGREWWLRTQRAIGPLVWHEPVNWIGPFDLYPKKP